MKILIAPDSFKESLSAKQVANCIEAGFRQVLPHAQYLQLPLADGGEGTVEVLLSGLRGDLQQHIVTGPPGEPLEAQWALLEGGKTALIEIAQASGLDRIAIDARDPTRASTFGTGQLILQAMDAGVERILLGLGGSATNDGGAGILQALGGRLLDKSGCELAPGGAALSDLARIDLTDLDPRCRSVELVLACDVDNPLCGPLGASPIFGPQKGASPQQVLQLDQALGQFARQVQLATGQDYAGATGFGAAGGTALGLSLAFPFEMKQGIEMVLDVLQADRLLEQVDLVITGEGQMDNQTLQGKTPYGIARRARAMQIPVIAVGGSLGREVEALYATMNAVYGTVRAPQSLPQVLDEAALNLTRTARNIAATLKLGQKLPLN